MTDTANPICNSRDAFLRKAERRYKTIPLPSGLTARIRNVTERERAAFDRRLRNKKGDVVNERLQWIRAFWIVTCVVDDNGNRLLKDSDVEAVGEMDAADTTLLADEIAKHCGFAGDEDFEELAKNSEATTGDDSPSS